VTPKFCPRCASPLEERDLAGRQRLVCSASCGHVFYNNPLPVVAALVEHEGRILLARGKGWPAAMFGLITGFLEQGESPQEGVLRELHEETGLSGEVVGLIGVYPFPQRNELIVAYHVRATGTVALSEELEETKSVLPERLRPWPFGTGLAVQDWIAARAGSS
jgi:NAD+ diphosphatase